MSNYYDLRDDIKKYPAAGLIIVFGGRSTGKTYSALRYCIEENKKFAFLKRTIKDVDGLIGGRTIKNGASASYKNATVDLVDADKSCFAPLNRDFNWRYLPWGTSGQEGEADVYHTDDKNQPVGKSIGRILALNKAAKYKGFDISDTDIIIFDEFVKPSFEKRTTGEDEMIVNLYKTIERDRELRGKETLKLIALANAESIVSPLIAAFDLYNELAKMQREKMEYMYLKDRGILLHMVKTPDAIVEADKRSFLYRALPDGSPMKEIIFGNTFAHDDLTMVVGKHPIKNYICEARVIFHGKMSFVYYNQQTGQRYITYIKYNKAPLYEFDLGVTVSKGLFEDYVSSKVFAFTQVLPEFETDDLKYLFLENSKYR